MQSQLRRNYEKFKKMRKDFLQRSSSNQGRYETKRIASTLSFHDNMNNWYLRELRKEKI